MSFQAAAQTLVVMKEESEKGRDDSVFLFLACSLISKGTQEV